jgi:KaiC/GvpD/RAD55 family RecA-like ATPase
MAESDAPASHFPTSRQSTGVDGLDELLGGGLIPGTLAVVVGASGSGKTQLGMQFLHAGCGQEGRAGIIFDMSARIDSQGHDDYAQRMFGWSVGKHGDHRFSSERCFDAKTPYGDYLHVFDSGGRRVTQRETGFDAWHDWQVELATKLETTLDFFYGNFVRGARRVVIDGIEPAQRPSESIQFELFEYVYHQILRKEAAWVARDLFRQRYRACAEAIERHVYDHHAIGAMLLVTAHESMLDQLIERPLADGDVLATANTLIYMGKVRDGERMARGLYVAKHRGSHCSDAIVRFSIDDGGIRLA